ncbi:MAG: metal-sensitive transcriptional regulator [Lentisphaerae bacterium]|nr:metal-sensitive transcriptional regulator [Lentisphaerota bacterium]
MAQKRHKTTHEENLDRLARIEGQVRGVRRMVEEAEYCIDIVTQIDAVQSALRAVRTRVLHKHMDHCVAEALRGGSRSAAEEKIGELVEMLKRSSR